MKSLQRVFTTALSLLVFNTNIIKAQNTTYNNSTNQGSSSINSGLYKTAIGVRLGGMTSGLTVKSFVNPNSALEGILGFGRAHFQITGLYERHEPIVNALGLNWFYGGGGHIGFFRYGGTYYYTEHGNVYYVAEPGETATIAGLDFILGLDYKFPNAPFNVGLDLKPFVDFFDGVQGYFDGGLSFRFAF